MRKISNEHYVISAIITCGIFLLGLFAGMVVEGSRVGFLRNVLESEKSEFASSQLQYSYLTSLNTKDQCPAVYAIFYENLKQLDDARLKLEKYIEDNRINDESFVILKRSYILEEVRYWLLAKQARQVCDQDFVWVLYFFSTEQECPDCGDQAFILDYLKNVFQEKLLIFALDGNFSREPMVGILKQQFNVTTYPTMVIENSTFSGFTSKNDLLGEICSKYRDVLEACK